jgi:transcriptional regulator with XRE-family HTH domain
MCKTRKKSVYSYQEVIMETIEVFTDVDMQAVAEGLFQARHRAHLSQNSVAVLAGLTTTHYNELERGKAPGMRVATLYKLCQVLRVSADALLGLTATPLSQDESMKA